MVLAMHGSLHIPMVNVAGASTEKPGLEWGMRSPGIHIPFLLKFGTYLVGSGRDFWITTVGRPYLVIETKGWHYNKVVLTMAENREWAEKINSAIGIIR